MQSSRVTSGPDFALPQVTTAFMGQKCISTTTEDSDFGHCRLASGSSRTFPAHSLLLPSRGHLLRRPHFLRRGAVELRLCLEGLMQFRMLHYLIVGLLLLLLLLLEGPELG